MSSSMITGERRWASARKGGMTSLGKITVPKPINLPSLRVENHGLDPVDLVPKGTISWGSKPSSSHAWGSQALSPSNTDGIGSPNRISGRPSSSGSGTRPSTAGSDKSHEPTGNAWGPSSRPSSASGVFSSNQTSMAAARPHSAETRPGSSQLSRFAEPMFENSAAWGAAGTAERLGVPSSKIDGFDLSSGDFPTLGTEKNTESHDQQGLRSVGQPASASGRLGTPKGRSEVSVTEVESADATTDKGSVNTWKRDSFPYIGEGVPPVADKWQREPQPYPNHNMPPQHFDPYHMIPVHNPPDGLWYRGPSSMPPYGPPGRPGGYPHESYGYYHPHPQHSARPLANSHTRTELNGPHSKHEGSCRPQMHDPYIRPVYPVRPGAYYRPAPYESFYGPPPAAFCNPSSQDASRMGVSNGPCIYNQYPSHNVHTHTGILQPRPSGQIPTNTPFVSEQVESVDYNTQRGPYKVLLKQHDSCEENDGVQKREHAPVSHTPYLERGKRPGVLGEDGFQVDCTNDEQVVTAKNAGYGEASSQSADSQGGCFEIPAGVSFCGDTDKAKLVRIFY
ncbi:hypothetical protein IFM89_017866 [Coptis chinensis]|uniref:BAT2 N-terminal domain-containing protein n=1 Tax=Coptis chinensis TaxID=261450 RepID=A0A835J0T1_9MAGN|nr:hypothetical protein IFM89_017866 [Coptis chinensis]